MPLHLLVKWEVVSPNSRWGQLESISIISSIPLFWFCISNVGVVWGGGGGCFNIKKNNIEKCPFTYWLNGRWFLQIVDGDSWNLYSLYPLFPCSDFVSQMWGWFGGGGCNVFLTFYAISNISRKKFCEYKPIISHLMFSSCFFCMLEILKSAPSLTATG